MNTELITALDILEKEKKISKKVLIEAIENSLLAACKNHFGKNENFTAKVDTKTGDFKVTAAKEVVETVDYPDAFRHVVSSCRTRSRHCTQERRHSLPFPGGKSRHNLTDASARHHHDPGCTRDFLRRFRHRHRPWRLCSWLHTEIHQARGKPIP